MSEWWVKYEGLVESASIKYPEENWVDLKSLHGFRLATFRFHNPNPTGIILIFHAMHLASSDTTHVAKRFFQEGYTVIAYDQEGHGKSGGPKGNIISLEDYTGDAEKYLLKAKSHYPQNTPIFLLGESMGGALCVMLSLKRPELIRGMLLFAPAIGIDPNFETGLRKMLKCMNICCSGCGLKKVDISMTTRNTHYAQYLNENPEFYTGKYNVRSLVAIVNAMENLQLQLEEVTTPVILFQGGTDKICSADNAKEFIRVCNSDDKEFVFYKDMYHTIFYEPEMPEIMERCVEWANRRL